MLHCLKASLGAPAGVAPLPNLPERVLPVAGRRCDGRQVCLAGLVRPIPEKLPPIRAVAGVRPDSTANCSNGKSLMRRCGQAAALVPDSDECNRPQWQSMRFDLVPPTSLCSAPGISAPPFGGAGYSAPCNNFETTASPPPDWLQASPAANGNGCSSTRRHESSSRCAGKPLPEFQGNEPDPDHLQRCFRADLPRHITW